MAKTRSQSTDVRDSNVRSRPPNTSTSDVVSDGGTAQHQRLIAKAIVDYEAKNLVELSFHAGDEIIDLKEIGPNFWEGSNRDQVIKEGVKPKRGLFNKEHVVFLLDTKESERPVRHNPRELKITNQDKKSPTTKQQIRLNQVVNKDVSQSIPSKQTLCGGLVVAVIAVVLCFTVGPLGLMNPRKIRVNITELKTQFSSQEPDMWETLRAGLMSSRSEGVQTFLVLHNSSRTAVCFIKKLSDNCVAYRANDISNSESFVSEVKNKLLAHKCLVMFDLEDLHPDGVAVLKGFCDAYQPIVPGTQFFFAFNAGTSLDTEAKKLARNLLESKWSKDYTHDEFGGTLTRLTQNVLKIHKEPNEPC